jgi:hypothetical protein
MTSILDNDTKTLHRWWGGMTAFAGALAIASCASAIMCKANLQIKCVNAVVWSLGPPCWFMLERWRLIPKYGGT